MKNILLFLTCMVFMAANTFGFATIGTEMMGRNKITFTSNVSDVQVLLNGQVIGQLRGDLASIVIPRDGAEQKVISFQKNGYKTTTITLNKKLDPIFWGNIFVGGSIGSSVDSLSTKNIYGYSPSEYYIDMQKI